MALICVIGILAAHPQRYWRPYTDIPQESLASYHAHGFALGNLAELWPNPLVARYVNPAAGDIAYYNHWPNGFFLALALAIQLFGNSETVGRSVALLFTLTGSFLLGRAFTGRLGFAHLAVPVLALFPIGIFALPFVFVDAAFLFWIGVAALAVAWSHERHRWASWLFRATIFAAPLFCQLIFPTLFFGVVARFLLRRDRRALAIDAACLALSSILLFVGLCATPSGFTHGFEELTAQFLHRTSWKVRYAENVTPSQLLETIVYHFRINFGWAWLIIGPAWLALVMARRATAFLLPSLFLYAFLLRNYVGVHLFAHLPLVAVSLYTLLQGVEIVADALVNHLGLSSPAWRRLAPVVAGIALLAALGAHALRQAQVPPYYGDVPEIVRDRTRLLNLWPAIKDSSWTALVFQNGESAGLSMGRMEMFFAGERIVQALRRKEPFRTCTVDLRAAALMPLAGSR